MRALAKQPRSTLSDAPRFRQGGLLRVEGAVEEGCRGRTGVRHPGPIGFAEQDAAGLCSGFGPSILVLPVHVRLAREPCAGAFPPT
jgi:hypothetical protein